MPESFRSYEHFVLHVSQCAHARVKLTFYLYVLGQNKINHRFYVAIGYFLELFFSFLCVNLYIISMNRVVSFWCC